MIFQQAQKKVFWLALCYTLRLTIVKPLLSPIAGVMIYTPFCRSSVHSYLPLLALCYTLHLTIVDPLLSPIAGVIKTVRYHAKIPARCLQPYIVTQWVGRLSNHWSCFSLFLFSIFVCTCLSGCLSLCQSVNRLCLSIFVSTLCLSVCLSLCLCLSLSLPLSVAPTLSRSLFFILFFSYWKSK